MGLTRSQWWLYLASVFCGIGAALFWSAEGAIAVGYPSSSQRGRMVSIWLAIRNIGPLITGIITLVLNTSGADAGKVTYRTYYALIVIQCLGFPVSLLMRTPRNVLRPDGTRIPHLTSSRTSVRKELCDMWRTLRTPHFALLIPLFITGVWGTTYQSNFTTAALSVRSRALVGLLTSIANMIADFSFGWLADAQWIGSQARRARLLWFGFVLLVTGLWIWQTVTQVHFTRTGQSVDWAGASSKFNNAIAAVILWKCVFMKLTGRFAYEALLGFYYWILGTYPHTDGTMERAVGMLRTFESLGNCMAYVIGTTFWPNLNQCILSFALWVACIVPTTFAVLRVPTYKVEHSEKHEVLGMAVQDDASQEDAFAVLQQKEKQLLQTDEVDKV